MDARTARRRRVGRHLVVVAVLAAALFALAACGRSDDPADVVVDGSVVPPGSGETGPPPPTPSPLPFTPEPLRSDLDPADLRGFQYPIAGSCLPTLDTLMPNAPRTYRNGVHEGLDFYHLSSCAPVSEGTPIYAMYGGVVIRADIDYVDITPLQVQTLAERTARQGFTDPETLDIYRGRQVWLDHGNGIVTRYAHMSSIEPGIVVGAEVRRGDLLGGVGESGTPESVTDPGVEMHLHAEVRIGESFLGADLPVEEVRRLYTRLFSDGVETPAGDVGDDTDNDDTDGDGAGAEPDADESDAPASEATDGEDTAG